MRTQSDDGRHHGRHLRSNGAGQDTAQVMADSMNFSLLRLVRFLNDGLEVMLDQQVRAIGI